MKPLIFFGSGVSRPHGLPNVDELTSALFENRWAKHGDSNFYAAQRAGARCPETQRCQEFLGRLTKAVASYYQKQRGSPPNYEDLFFLVEQLQYDEFAWDDNAAVYRFRQEIKRLSTDLSRSPNLVDSKYWFQNLTSTCVDFIQCVVWHELRSGKCPVGLDLLIELTDLDGAQPLTVCTINHDLLVERTFRDAGISYIDGFGPAKKGFDFSMQQISRQALVRRRS